MDAAQVPRASLHPLIFASVLPWRGRLASLCAAASSGGGRNESKTICAPRRCGILPVASGARFLVFTPRFIVFMSCQIAFVSCQVAFALLLIAFVSLQIAFEPPLLANVSRFCRFLCAVCKESLPYICKRAARSLDLCAICTEQVLRNRDFAGARTYLFIRASYGKTRQSIGKRH